MNNFSSALPWGLSQETLQEIVGENFNFVSTVDPPRPFGGYNGEKALIRVALDGSVSKRYF